VTGGSGERGEGGRETAEWMSGSGEKKVVGESGEEEEEEGEEECAVDDGRGGERMARYMDEISSLTMMSSF
jgi:hypothetical protein